MFASELEFSALPGGIIRAYRKKKSACIRVVFILVVVFVDS